MPLSSTVEGQGGASREPRAAARQRVPTQFLQEINNVTLRATEVRDQQMTAGLSALRLRTPEGPSHRSGIRLIPPAPKIRSSPELKQLCWCVSSDLDGSWTVKHPLCYFHFPAAAVVPIRPLESLRVDN